MLYSCARGYSCHAPFIKMGEIENLPNPKPRRQPHSRREFLWNTSARFPMLALIDLLSRDGFFRSQALAAPAKTGAQAKSLLAAREPHFPTKAKHVVFLFMNGAPSQVDTFDPKPALTKYDGTPYQGDAVIGSNNRPIGNLMQSPFEFTNHGQSGLPISSLFPHTAKHADDLCVIRSLQTDTAAHASGCIQMNTGSVVIGKPSLGSWLSYGLGTESEDLPSFVVMTDPRGGPIGSASNWTAGFMPAAYQGTLFRSGGSPLLNLETPKGVSERTQRHSLDLLKHLNESHQQRYEGDSELEARIHSYELAYRMQTTAAEVVNLDAESRQTREMYGLHNELTEDFGRTPTSEGVGKPGRDHDWQGFTMWLAGAGVKGGQAIGATDELGFKAVEDPWYVSDLHATILHLMGLDHTKLTYFYQGLDQRLTGVRGEVIRKALA